MAGMFGCGRSRACPRPPVPQLAVRRAQPTRFLGLAGAGAQAPER